MTGGQMNKDIRDNLKPTDDVPNGKGSGAESNGTAAKEQGQKTGQQKTADARSTKRPAAETRKRQSVRRAGQGKGPCQL